MSGKRYTDEFKAEAVRQVIDRGHPVADVAGRLGISQHSLYRWVRAARPLREEQEAADLDEAQTEIKRLRKELARTREEREILKGAAEDSTGQCNTTCPTTLPGRIVSCRELVGQGLRLTRSANCGV